MTSGVEAVVTELLEVEEFRYLMAKVTLFNSVWVVFRTRVFAFLVFGMNV